MSRALCQIRTKVLTTDTSSTLTVVVAAATTVVYACKSIAAIVCVSGFIGPPCIQRPESHAYDRQLQKPY